MGPLPGTTTRLLQDHPAAPCPAVVLEAQAARGAAAKEKEEEKKQAEAERREKEEAEKREELEAAARKHLAIEEARAAKNAKCAQARTLPFVACCARCAS